MNASHHPKFLGVPVRRLTVALYAVSPRFAAGFPLRSLTRKGSSFVAGIFAFMALCTTARANYACNEIPSAMGMSYILITDVETTCTGTFPHQLGYFFEAVGGYGDKSEVSQVSELLKVDLSLFQNYDYGEDDPEIEKTFWKDVHHFEQVIHAFIDSINAHPDFYKMVKYNRHSTRTDELFKAMAGSSDSADFRKYYDMIQKDQENFFPVDSGYLSEGRILNDLKGLLNTLACFRSHGVKQIKLLYI